MSIVSPGGGSVGQHGRQRRLPGRGCPARRTTGPAPVPPESCSGDSVAVEGRVEAGRLRPDGRHRESFAKIGHRHFKVSWTVSMNGTNLIVFRETRQLCVDFLGWGREGEFRT